MFSQNAPRDDPLEWGAQKKSIHALKKLKRKHTMKTRQKKNKQEKKIVYKASSKEGGLHFSNGTSLKSVKKEKK